MGVHADYHISDCSARKGQTQEAAANRHALQHGPTPWSTHGATEKVGDHRRSLALERRPAEAALWTETKEGAGPVNGGA